MALIDAYVNCILDLSNYMDCVMTEVGRGERAVFCERKRCMLPHIVRVAERANRD